jgi:hypothetical protein
MKATHKDHEVLVGFNKVELISGQFVFGRKVASEETGLSEQEIRTCLRNLTKLGNLTIKSTNRYSVITIVNWGDYQVEQCESTNTSTGSQPAGNQQVTTYKNERTKEQKKKPIKNKYLDCVLLTEEEHTKLKVLFPSTLDERIAKLDEYVMSVGKKYKSHYHTILTWARKDGWNGEPETDRDLSQY